MKVNKRKQAKNRGGYMLPPFEEDERILTQYTPFSDSLNERVKQNTVMSSGHLISELVPPRSDEMIQDLIVETSN